MTKNKSRLFVAIEVEKKIREDLHNISSSFQDFSLRWTKEENIHLTLKFIGDFPKDNLGALKKKIEDLIGETPSFSLKLKGLGVFTPRKPQVLWVGIERDDHLWNLAENLDQGLVALGIDAEKRPYQPHLTLARMASKKEWGDPQKLVAQVSEMDFQAEAKIGKISLVESLLQKTGVLYTPLKTFVLH